MPRDGGGIGMGLDSHSSTREIPNTSSSQSGGSISPSSLNYINYPNNLLRKSSTSNPRFTQDTQKSARPGSTPELIMDGESLEVQTGGDGHDETINDDNDDEPTNKPTKTLLRKTGENGIGRGESSEDSADDSDTSSTLERAAPDGGWGWVVVAAAFAINLVADGVTFSFGVYYVEFLEYFKQSKSATAWIGSLLAAMPLLSGPIASSLTDRYGCRKVTIAGSLLSSLGFILSSFANSVEMLYVTFGMITGFGLSLCYVAAVVIVAYYFEQRRSLATGISVCGGGIGTFIFAPLTQFLFQKYGWRNATRVLAGTFLYLCICGILMRDLEWTKKSRNSRRLNNSPSLDSSTSREIPGSQPRRLCTSALCIPTFLQEQENLARLRNCNQCQRRSLFQPLSCPRSNNSAGSLPNDSDHSSPRQKSESEVPVQPMSDNLVPLVVNFVMGDGTTNVTQNVASQNATAKNATPIIHSHSIPQNMTSNNSPGVGIHRHSLTYRGAVLSLKRYRLRPASSCPDIISVATEGPNTHEWKAVVADVCKWCRALCEWRSLSTSRRFILFVISNFLLYMWYDVMYIYLQEAAQKSYSHKESSWLISILGLFNMAGNLTLGYMGDKQWIDASLVYGICMIFCGFSAIILPTVMSWNYVSLAMDCGLYGLTIAANYSLTSVILVKVVSLERFASAYGLLLLIQGIGNLVGPPIAGVIYDYTDTSSWSFRISGVGIILSSVFVLVPKIWGKCSNEENVVDKDEEKQ